MAYLVHGVLVGQKMLFGCYKKESVARAAQRRMAAKSKLKITSWAIKKGKCPRWMTGKNRGDV